MKNRLSVGELFDILDTGITLLMDKNDSNENIKNIKAISLLLEERFRNCTGGQIRIGGEKINLN